jgi:hypothetical protein
MVCMRSLSTCGLYGFEIFIYVLWCDLFMHIYVICDICIIVTHLDYHLITLSSKHPHILHDLYVEAPTCSYLSM